MSQEQSLMKWYKINILTEELNEIHVEIIVILFF